MSTPTFFNTGALKLAMATGRIEFDAGYPQRSYLPVKVGTVQAAASPVAVSDTSVTASSQILLTPKTIGGTPAAPYISAISAGSGFSVTFGASDTTLYNYAIIG